MQRYLLDRIMNPNTFLFQSAEITEDDSDFQQAIINSMNQYSDDNDDSH